MLQPVLTRTLLLVGLGLVGVMTPLLPAAAQIRIDPALRFDPAAGPVDVLVHLRHDVAHVERALPPGSGPEGFARRVTAQVDRLRSRADIGQASLLRELKARGVPHRAFWVANVVQVHATPEILQWLAQRDDVLALAADVQVSAGLPGLNGSRVKMVWPRLATETAISTTAMGTTTRTVKMRCIM